MPSGFLDTRICVAGSRAGALGVIDLGSRMELTTRDALAKAGALLRGRSFAVRVQPEALNPQALTSFPENLRVVIVAEARDGQWSDALFEVRRAKKLVLAEVTTRDAAEEAWASGYDGLIVAGNEGGGVVSDESSLILLQAVVDQAPPGAMIWVRGGIGPVSAAGVIAAGATGVVLDGALLLARESPLAESVRERLSRWDGAETVTFRGVEGPVVRGFAPPRSAILDRLREAAEQGADLRALMGWDANSFWPAGQDAAHAAELARRFVTVGGIVSAVEAAIDDALMTARNHWPFAAETSALAEAHATRYPIVQGPMTRVSDRPEFAVAVAEGGALPFLALAMMSGEEVRALLEDARVQLAGRSWGVGMLGFLESDVRAAQVRAILDAKPPFALIAGGRPDQADELERAGISTYLHVPSPGLLGQFLRDGARKFVLEGRECGGHVGPRSSLVLWEQAGRVLLDAIERGLDATELQILYAGGVHDARSAAAVAAISAPLASQGVKVGLLVGTAYLFTREAVDSGAVVDGFQREALRCSKTVLLETGPGHVVRVSPTPFARRFEAERQRLTREGRTADQIRTDLEGLNVGRLRVAAKGVDRRNGPGSHLIDVAIEEQEANGLYMVGQAATLRRQLITIATLHDEIAEGGRAWLDRPTRPPRPKRKKRSRPSDIAIVGMAAVVPGAAEVSQFWENTLRGVDSITEIPDDRWDWRLYYDADPKAPDKIISRWGGFVPEIPFDPLQYGMPPATLPSIEPLHLLTLEVVRAALDDAGYRVRPFPRERTAVVLGAGGGAAQLAMGYAFRSYLPMLDTVIPGAGSDALAACAGHLPEWTEDSFPGILLNVAAGRIANRFDLGGANYTVDAACGSSLAAASLAVRELESGAADMVVLGGADTVQNPFTYLAFSKTHAFSPRGRCRPFDAKADGIVISEGVAVVILKRLADAERDGDRIYSVIKGLGASSDGREKSLTAPRFEGQVRALRRAYDKAGISPAAVGYVEAHGTGTAAGDLAEVNALKSVFSAAGAEKEGCALGSVKSLIGHTKCAAGLAGLINASLALHHRILPPTIGVETPSPRAAFPESPFHLSTRARPWLGASDDRPRRAGVSAFGFGGTNFHAVLEAYEGDSTPRSSAMLDRPAELFVWQAANSLELIKVLERFDQALTAGPVPALRDLAHGLASALPVALLEGPRLAIVASSADDLQQKLRRARTAIVGNDVEYLDPSGICFNSRASRPAGRLAFLFPGQGSQAVEMLGELAVYFPEVLDALDVFDHTLARLGRKPIGPIVFPPPSTIEHHLTACQHALASPEVAQPAIGAASLGLLDLFAALKIEPDALAGHSYGEFVALHAAGVFSREGLAELSEARGRFLIDAVGEEAGSMIALACGATEADDLIRNLPGAVVANDNGPSQTVLSGPRSAMNRALTIAEERGLRARSLPVACGFHSPLVKGARGPLIELAARLSLQGPTPPVYSNVNAGVYPTGLDHLAENLGDHLVGRVRFASMIETMHADDVRIFVEVGPKSVLTGLVGSILKDRPHLALACDPAGKTGVAGLLNTVGRLFVAGVAMDTRHLTASRSNRRVDCAADRFESTEPPLSPSTWMVNGSRSRPASGPASRVFGQGSALPRPKTNKHSLTNGRDGLAVIPPSSNGHATKPNARSNGQRKPETDAVFTVFQKTMQSFLDVQRSTMLDYLAGSRLAEPARRPQPIITENPVDPQPVERLPEVTQEVQHVKDDGATIESRLLAIVRDRTGYPTEMLGLDLDLEADLGIDSIKRVEILGSLRDELPNVGQNGSETELMEQLTRAKTLGAIVDRANRHINLRNGKSESSKTLDRNLAAITVKPALTSVEPSRVRRMVLEAIDAPLPSQTGTSALARGGLILLTDDGQGVADEAARVLREAGFATILLTHSSNAEPVESANRRYVDLTSADSVEQVFQSLRQEKPIIGLVHALPLRNAEKAELNGAIWAERFAVEVRGLYLLARAASHDLAASAARGGAGLIAASALGGSFASLKDAPAEFFPGHGAIAGMIKTLAREWEGVHSRVVDFDTRESAAILGQRLADEILSADRRAEVGYHKGRRIALKAVVSDLPPENHPRIDIQPGEPILITGGARGITSTLALDLARRWRPTLLLIGMSPLPPDRDEDDVMGLDDPIAIKARLRARLNQPGKSATPAEVERLYQSLRRGREIRTNLAALRRAGATVEYACVDVCDRDALQVKLADWRERHGPPIGLVHGAGVIQDKLLVDKTPQSFDRVIGPKLDGAVSLAGLIDPAPLRFAAFFSSIAGRFGNRGQADYAAANDAVNKLAIWLDGRWACRVVSLIWGPWSGVGMVSDLEEHLGRQGLGMITPGEGCNRLGDELERGRKGVVEVIVAGDLGNLVDPLETDGQS